MMLSISSGQLRGHRLATPKGVRPTTSRLREALFSYLRDGLSRRNWCHDARVLDLFSGSGALGLEALSCGAKEVLFVEHSKNVCQVLYNNIKHLHLEKQTTVWKRSALRLPCPPERFLRQTQLIMMDPPYHQLYDHWQMLFRHILRKKWLSNKGILVMESTQKTTFLLVKNVPQDFHTMKCIRCLEAGDSAISLWHNGESTTMK